MNRIKSSFILLISIVLVMTIVISTHELGHVAFAWSRGYETELTYINSEGFPFVGGFATIPKEPLRPEDIRFIACGGIVFNFLIAMLSYGFYKRVENTRIRGFLFTLLVASLISGFANALPIGHFDGSFIWTKL